MNNNIKNYIITSLLIIISILGILLINEKPSPQLKGADTKKIEKKINFCQQFIDKGFYYKVWSETNPKINKTHIFCGEINSRGKASGFHSRFEGKNPGTAKITKIEKKNNIGVYTAKIEIKDLKKGFSKTKFSSIFPDKLSNREVEKAIINAWKNQNFYKKSKFRGPSGHGFQVEGYTLKGKINTAYPIYKK